MKQDANRWHSSKTRRRTVSQASSRREEEPQGNNGGRMAHLWSEKCKWEPGRVGVCRQVVTQIGRTGVFGEEPEADKQAQTKLPSWLPNHIWSSVWGLQDQLQYTEKNLIRCRMTNSKRLENINTCCPLLQDGRHKASVSRICFQDILNHLHLQRRNQIKAVWLFYLFAMRFFRFGFVPFVYLEEQKEQFLFCNIIIVVIIILLFMQQTTISFIYISIETEG